MKSNVMLEGIKNQNCTGCSSCSGICPTNAINIELTEDGFYEPVIDESKCINCRLCTNVCYKYDESIQESDEATCKAYAAINKSEYELKTSTSGGVSIELMKAALNQGYKVVGVAYDYEKDIAITKVVDKIEELEQFKGSKYFQSYTEEAFKTIAKDKSEQKYAIFGTPCQIYGISKLAEIQKNRERYLLVDLFCHGCPSLNLWKKSLEYYKEKTNQEKFDHIEFRSKVHGWHEFGFEFRNKELIFANKKINDPFYELFFGMNTHNSACYECRMRSSFAYTDIRLGDFWGVEYDMDMKGVSAVIVVSELGQKIIDNIKNKVDLKAHTISETIHAQSYGKEHYYNEKIRKKTLEELNGEKEILRVLKEHRKSYSKKKILKLYSKNMVKLLPKSIYFKIKKVMHNV